MPNLNMNRYVSDQGDAAATERRELIALVDRLQSDLKEAQQRSEARVKMLELLHQDLFKANVDLLRQRDGLRRHLVATEDAYDRALQMNLDLQDKLDVFESWLPLPHEDFDDTLGTATHDAEAGEGVSALMGGLETMSVPIIPRQYAEAAVDKALAEINEAGKAEVQAEAEIVLKRVPPRSEMSAFDQKREWAEGEVREVHGDRAKMKDTLVSTQNACRRYKKRLARQKEQLKVLQELADTGFYLYEELSLALKRQRDRSSAFAFVPNPPRLRQLCDDFHNKFNEVAEVLSHE